ncbi:transporter [Aquiflexum sp. TKW24L]|uniref:TolB family protein n=1 Tax=Aquiflexum sp. TKW24L TaxID=2942212 RepID=UPI0020C08E03|nr:transporter [Aquiflexum sp. TKW24L]MCL6257945.1 transporter [Aquiflexum sp. TKW24L]
MKRLLALILLVSFNSIAQVPKELSSELIILKVKSGKEKVLIKENRHFEAPNWSRDGKFLIINAGGFLEKIDLKGNNLGKINPEGINTVNNDHGLSFDGKILVFSKNDKDAAPTNNSRVYVANADGSNPRLVTPNFPSYWHGISPDNNFLIYTARRNDDWDLFKIPTQGGTEINITNTAGLDDGSEYSYDGNWIYFNSHRSGRMHIYRMRPDGSGVAQLTEDELDNWFPHPSPDNKSIVYISYLEDQKAGHPFGKEVKLRIMNLETKEIKDITPVFYGGQGTINVHSWSPDGKSIAFVRYTDLTKK